MNLCVDMIFVNIKKTRYNLACDCRSFLFFYENVYQTDKNNLVHIVIMVSFIVTFI